MQNSDEARRKVGRLERIERLRRRLHEMSTWRLAMAAQEKTRLEAEHVGMIEALNDGLMAYGPASAAGTRRVRALERQMAIANQLEKGLEKRVLEEGRLAKLADISLGAARDAWREGVERKSLEELIDASVAADSASRKP